MSSIKDKEKRQKRRERQQKERHTKKNKKIKKSILKKEHWRLIKPYFNFKKQKIMWCFLVGLTPLMAGASSTIPTGLDINRFYYQIGGASDYSFPPAPYATPINLSVRAGLGLGNQCGMYNPALSISNTLNDLQDSVNNLTENLIANATGSLAEMPMYFLALANPTLYNLLNNSLINAHAIIDASVKSCQETRDEISQGQNPYQDWATLSVGESWKQHLSLTATGDEDINTANSDITQTAGDDGVNWVQGSTASDGTFHAGGKNQPPIHVITDTVQAGYNALLNRDYSSNQPAPTNSDLYNQFQTPADAIAWITTALGDQNITTCNDASCKSAQGTIAGRGLLPWMTICTEQNKNDCVDTINGKIQDLVAGTTAITKENLLAVSANDLVISPQSIHTLQNIDASQQGIFIHKLAQEITMQRVMGKALTAHDILQAGRQVPAIVANRPAQYIIQDKIKDLEDDIHSLSFESQVRKQMMSNTLLNLIDFSSNQQNQAFSVGQIHTTQPMLENSALPSAGGKP